MIHYPTEVCFIVFKRYMSKAEQLDFDKLLVKYKDTRHKQFFNAMLKHFDIEKLRTQPLIWQDIWLYNYINYEATEKLRRDGLFKKYVKEIFIYDDEEFKSYLKSMPPADKAKLQAIKDHHSPM